MLIYQYLFSKRGTLRFRDYLDIEGRRRRQRTISRVSLLLSASSQWKKMFSSDNDQSMITVTGFDCNSFESMLQLFKPHEDSLDRRVRWHNIQEHQPWTTKRKAETIICWHVSCYNACLFSVLWPKFVLMSWFGFTGTNGNVWLRFGRRVLRNLLLQHPLARVEWPTDARCLELARISGERHSVLPDVFCFADGCFGKTGNVL